MKAETAAMIMMSGSADLEDITITENGEYESVDHDGFDVVTVEVPTMVECAEEVAEILGVDTSQEWDCDDIKTKAQEVVDENEELKEENDELKEENESLQEQLDDCHECKDQVVAAIQQYISDYDPDPDECPAPKIPDVYQQGKDDEAEEDPPGYKFPEDTDPTDPVWLPIIGANPVKDETLDVSVFVCCYDGTNYINITKQQNPDTYGFRPAIGWNYDNHTDHSGFGDIGLNTAGDYGEIVGYTVSANGSVVLHLHTHIYGWGYDDQGQYTLDWHDKYYDTIPSQAQQELAGYGDPTHTYRVKNI